MYKYIRNQVTRLYNQKSPAIGIGIYRSLYGFVTLQEIIFLLYFDHLIFDPIPYIDVEYPMIPFFLCLWAISSFFIFIGYQCQISIIVNYIFWIIFVQFTPMQRDFDGGFDAFMICAGFFLMFLPTDKAFSIDQLRSKLTHPFFHLHKSAINEIPALCYYVPILFCLGFLYFDSAIHKLFAEHWRNGLGAWLPSTQPYYISAIDFSWLLNQEYLQKFIGYLIFAFQFSFVFLFFNRYLQPIYLFIGMGLHAGIALSLNIYPFGIGMLIFYTLMIPFSWWNYLRLRIESNTPKLTVFYDKNCPLCNRTVFILKHFDIFNNLSFLNAQDHAHNHHQLSDIPIDTLLTDLYAFDSNNVYKGLDTYINILFKMQYLSPIGLILKTPGIYHFAKVKYRNIADNRLRNTCDIECHIPKLINTFSFYSSIFEAPDPLTQKNKLSKLTKALILIAILQLNSTIHYGLLYRLNIDLKNSALGLTFHQASNSLLMLSQTFLGIIPHALYLHDHFAGYSQIIAITYLDNNGKEQWLPFINQEGRILAPHWGRVHSMWANIAVTPHIDHKRLNKFIMKVTAYWAPKLGLSLADCTFYIKTKPNISPNQWIYDLRRINASNEWSTSGIATWKDFTYSSKLDLSND
ncbi:DCC1-like thiol-disulfide oxidoreductase family protein [Methylicorpusculum oleiharenae]|uniref:DCC1-like thiol-disulfide oxidoreductase family protein n=1 Tax=Methylicorpusculum oleiharenae TaxID=1338687 RepID=UPI001357D98E|nr:DCC1-like thiol-disulfide oxidoreductase family protein [Methylicorpusculum oleiharenae]MCD2449283.1 DCC1-like thiol-disulfide oxidoreductase family protein [Methylicorpusculum oleiharenae]